ncbi:MAG: serine/threonine-protein kinase [Acidobacteriota bacterium]
MTGTVLAERYEVGPELGRGATSVVYRARDRVLGADVALKILAPHLGRDAAATRSFEREVHASRRVQSDAVARIHELRRDGESCFIVMELGPRGTLKDHLLVSGALAPGAFELLMRSVADGLAACHAQGILHRDLKPSNILFDPDRSEVKLIDFGVARMARAVDASDAGSVVGTPEYMAPEQFEEPVPDPRSDLYAAGAVFYEAATGLPPVTGETLPEVLRKHRSGVTVRPRDLGARIGEATEAIIMRLLRPAAVERFQTAVELVDALHPREAPRSERRPAVGAACPACQAVRVPGIPFCPSCAEDLGELDRAGTWQVVIAKASGSRAVGRALGKLCCPPVVRRSSVKLTPPLVALYLASEPMARWLAGELRKKGVVATAQRIPVAWIGLLSVSFAVLLSLAGHFFLVSTFGAPSVTYANMGPALVLVTGLLGILATVRAVLLHRKVAAYVSPLAGRAEESGILAAGRSQRALRTPRFRALGRELLVTAHDLLERASADERRGIEELVGAGYRALLRLDASLASILEGASRDPAVLDDVAAGTQAILAIQAELRSKRASALGQAIVELKARGVDPAPIDAMAVSVVEAAR